MKTYHGIGAALLLVAIWPAVILLNRPGPLILGLPPFSFGMLAINIVAAAVTAAACFLLDE